MRSGVFLFCVALSAAEPPPLRVHELIQEALSANPEILAAQKLWEAARQRPAQAGSLPDPMMSAGYASSGRPWPGAGLGREPVANIGFMVSQQLPGPGKRQLRTAVATREAEEIQQEYLQAQLRVVSAVKKSYHELHHAWIIIELLERNRTLLERVLRVTEARYAVGKGAQSDILKAQTQLSLLAARIAKAEQDRQRSEAEINLLRAQSPDAPVGRPPMQTAKETLITLEQLYTQARENSPLLGREVKRIQKTEIAMNLARKETAPDYTVSAGYFSMGTMPPMYQARVDFNLPQFFGARKKAMVTEQANMLQQTRRMYEAVDQNVLFRIKDDWLVSGTSWKLMQMYATTLIPQAALTLESSLSAYQTGQVDFLTLLSNLQSVLEYEMNYHEEMMSYHLALVRLEEVTGLLLIQE